MREAVLQVAVIAALTGCGRVDFGSSTGDGGTDADSAVPPSINRVFLTSTKQSPSTFAGLAGADALCTSLARSAALDGTFVAWLSTNQDPVVTAPSRLAGKRGWVRTDGIPVADTVDDLIASRLLAPIRVDERGIDLGDISSPELVATGTLGGGTQSFATCDDYAPPVASDHDVSIGWAHHVGFSWTRRNEGPCEDTYRLYCFQIDFAEPLVIVPTEGRTAFVSTSLLTTDAGLAAADALCNADAAANQVPGAFRALLPGDGVSAASRFDLDGASWVRRDGVPLAATARDFMDFLGTVSLAVDAAGALTDGTVFTGIGVSAYDTPQYNATCGAWTDATLDVSDAEVSATGRGTFHGTYRTGGCATPQRVYCLEQ